jgi:hypothetical protein
MNKNFKISLIVIAVIFITALFLWLVNLQKQKQAAPATSQETQGAASTETPGQLPVGKKYPEYSIRVENIDDSSQIKSAFQNYVNQDPNVFPSYGKEGISMDSPVNDKAGKKVDLQTFLSSVGANINPEIKNLVGSNYYGMFYCLGENGQKEYAIALDVVPTDPKNLQSENKIAKDAMKKWEPYILKDLRAILFPLDNFSESDLNQNINFQDGEFHYANLSVSGRGESINYDVKIDEGNAVNRIYITTSRECLKKSFEYLFDY